jgi:hypothetical protein
MKHDAFFLGKGKVSTLATGMECVGAANHGILSTLIAKRLGVYERVAVGLVQDGKSILGAL